MEASVAEGGRSFGPTIVGPYKGLQKRTGGLRLLIPKEQRRIQRRSRVKKGRPKSAPTGAGCDASQDWECARIERRCLPGKRLPSRSLQTQRICGAERRCSTLNVLRWKDE